MVLRKDNNFIYEICRYLCIYWKNWKVNLHLMVPNIILLNFFCTETYRTLRITTYGPLYKWFVCTFYRNYQICLLIKLIFVFLHVGWSSHYNFAKYTSNGEDNPLVRSSDNKKKIHRSCQINCLSIKKISLYN